MLLFIFCLFNAIVLIQFCYYIFIFGKFSFAKRQSFEKKNIPISVIVCAKNEEENVKKNIPILLNQKYLNFEIVLIDDASRDETLEVFEEFEKNNSKIKLVKVENNEAFWGNKKFALTLGIKAATYENLLFIDADCYPETENWISEMSACFTSEKSIILGYGGYEKIKGSFLNLLIRFENVLIAMQYLGWAKAGKPYMGVGRNLAYTKTEFFNNNGFIQHMKIRSGDDDLFVNQASNKKNTAFNFHWESFTFSIPKTTFSDWIMQKRRHVSTAKYYKFFDKMQLSLFFASQFLFVLLSVLLIVFMFNWQIVVGLILFRYFFVAITLFKSSKKLFENDVIYTFPFLEISLLIIQIYVYFRNLISKPVTWK